MLSHDFLTPLLPGLYLVATPIGNLGDMTLRAIETLRRAAAIYAEDTRVTRKLLQHYGVHTPLHVYHDQSPARVYQQITERIRNGEAVALVSDAGTPLISDPGYRLVAALHQENLSVYSVPGPCAVISALTISGLPSHGFTFLGFPPSTAQMRRRFLADYCRQPLSVILYEAPQRLCGLLADLATLSPHHEVAVIREITKKFEEVKRGSAAELLEYYTEHPPRGEIVVIIGPAPDTEDHSEEALDLAVIEALQTMSVRDAVAYVSATTGIAKKQVYQRALLHKDALRWQAASDMLDEGGA